MARTAPTSGLVSSPRRWKANAKERWDARNYDVCRDADGGLPVKETVRLFEDPMLAALNNVGHAVEHCAVDQATLDALDSAIGRQLLVRRSESLALYTVVATGSVPSPSVEVGTGGRARLRSSPGVAIGRSSPAYADGAAIATVETDFTEGQGAARLTEEVLGDDGTGLAVLAPHGGRIERHTDEQAESVYRALAQESRPVRAWIARGFNPSGAHTCWHITSSEISEHSFAKLGSFFPTGPRGAFSHAVALHGHDDSDVVVVGGGRPGDETHTKLKEELASRIRDALSEVTAEAPEVEVELFGPLAGAERRNIVNRVTARGNGIQIEQPIGVRSDPEQREAIAGAVADFYLERIETPAVGDRA
jgi:phage replication-related protein YjqB (UPF0714/DUF867 family)